MLRLPKSTLIGRPSKPANVNSFSICLHLFFVLTAATRQRRPRRRHTRVQSTRPRQGAPDARHRPAVSTYTITHAAAVERATPAHSPDDSPIRPVDVSCVALHAATPGRSDLTREPTQQSDLTIDPNITFAVELAPSRGLRSYPFLQHSCAYLSRCHFVPSPVANWKQLQMHLFASWSLVSCEHEHWYFGVVFRLKQIYNRPVQNTSEQQPNRITGPTNTRPIQTLIKSTLCNKNHEQMQRRFPHFSKMPRCTRYNRGG